MATDQIITKITKAQFLTGLDLIFEYSVFSFENVCYKETFGTPMGAPLSPVLAELIMEHMEDV